MENEECTLCYEILEELVKKDEFNYLVKCSDCSYIACKNCLEKWNKACPQCRKERTFDINYTDDDNDINGFLRRLMEIITVDEFNMLTRAARAPRAPRAPQIPIPMVPPVPQQVPPGPEVREGKIYNPETKRWVLRNGKVGRRLQNSTGAGAAN